MKHPSEEQLALHYYGESPEPAAFEVHLANCSQCRTAYQELVAALRAIDVPVPERGEDYGRQVWRRFQPRLHGPRPVVRLRPRWVLAAGMAVLVVAAFLAGRFWPARTLPRPLAPEVRERILLVAVGGHLERSEMVLVELLNAQVNGAVDISNEQQRAQDLLASSRLYRAAAARAGKTGVISLLEELERLLLEVAHSPSPLPPAQLDALHRRIEDEDLLFRVRIAGAGLRRPETILRGTS